MRGEIEGRIGFYAFRLFDHCGRAPWLITLRIGIENATTGGAYPQSWAVMDDFGNLVAVGGWR